MELDRKLADGLAAMQLALPAGAQHKLLVYIDLLAKWNRTYNLTAVRDPGEMVSRHLLDSLAVLPYMHGKSLADLGSGAGLPGIPLAIARPDVAVTLVESNGKKARFLREAVRSLPLSNVTVDQARVQDAIGTFDTITARAFASLPNMLAWAGHLLAPNGRWLALKGRVDPAELGAVPRGFRVVVHELRVPGTDGGRCVVELARA
ncbi:MAG: 16S rRNA (guanine(527)-N(7))-methyltransferase RsmG [Xanthomonadaceae bacterium]|nr:16S rRNA (guanine(527)-N(7))-methyltransferase RsmG [Xanthomonadaceae bacterium]MBU6476969.1 16S rRNA (guanine(527)-N(7))-methyltransferase RsmG [Xanthomonadaceae bacterium]MDE2053330.1 16S rRNA (guanine(527)-N(7))-methyltransferase RsmG [Xanthomonadaceae bacterium]MDE2224577.1 16S rRNA (guanine(527)-N(7))-methyltransferase RsmG [Xanthomonadaceae bacterium]